MVIERGSFALNISDLKKLKIYNICNDEIKERLEAICNNNHSVITRVADFLISFETLDQNIKLNRTQSATSVIDTFSYIQENKNSDPVFVVCDIISAKDNMSFAIVKNSMAAHSVSHIMQTEELQFDDRLSKCTIKLYKGYSGSLSYDLNNSHEMD